MADGGHTLSPKQEEFVAAYIGPAKSNATEAARLAGYKHPNKQGPALLVNLGIRERIEAYLAEIKADGIANKQNRLDSYRDDFALTERVIAARATHYGGKAPGGDTGLIVGQLKLVKHIDDTDDETGQRIWFEEQWEYVVDTGLMNERRQLRKQIAQELGEWSEKSEHTIKGLTFADLYSLAADAGASPVGRGQGG